MKNTFVIIRRFTKASISFLQDTRESKATVFLIRTWMAIRSQCFSDAVLESPHALVGSCAVAIAINVICPAGSS